MLKQLAVQYYLEEKLSCAQSIFLAANDVYHLGLTREDAKLVSAFAGGCGCGNICGALAGALAVLGKIMLTGQEPYTLQLKEASTRLVEAFEKECGSTLCSTLTPKYKNEEMRCAQVVGIMADILQMEIETQNTQTVTQ